MAEQQVAIGHGRPVQIGAAVATGANTNTMTYDFTRSTHTFYLVPHGTVTTCSLQVQASPDGGTTWINVGAADTTTTAHVNTVTVAAKDVRVAVTVVGGGNFDVYVTAV